MLVIGLTGSIGMGKSTAAAHLRERGVAVFDADAEVHRLYTSEAVRLIEAAFPGCTSVAGVDRAKLKVALGRDPRGFERLNALVHPLVRDGQRRFLRAEFAKGAWAAVVEVPLLFEGGGNELVDAVVVVSADSGTQRARVLGRPGMSEASLALILSRQMSDTEKRARADFVVDTSGPIADTQTQIDAVLAALRSRPQRAFQQHWV
jgi:dephospho-CoA kinase